MQRRIDRDVRGRGRRHRRAMFGGGPERGLLDVLGGRGLGPDGAVLRFSVLCAVRRAVGLRRIGGRCGSIRISRAHVAACAGVSRDRRDLGLGLAVGRWRMPWPLGSVEAGRVGIARQPASAASAALV